MRHISDDQRRIRLARRHGVHPGHRHPDAETATRAMVVLHATEAPSVHLSLAARVDPITIDDVETALYGERTLVKQLAMRRTLFAFPRELMPATLASASARVAEAQLRRIASVAVQAGVTTDGVRWVEDALLAVLDEFGSGAELDTAAVRERVPVAATKLVWGSGRWAQEQFVGGHLLLLLGARGVLVRGPNNGHWRIARPSWTPMRSWLGEEVATLDEASGYAELVRRWLWAFGPGTETDLVWWLGSTKTAARRALAAVDAVPVSLDSGDTGWVLPGDDLPEPEVAPWAALLPALDPTTMGWKQRDHYLDPDDVPYLFDSVGNGGPTAWWNGRIVGSWTQDPDARVRLVLRSDPGAQARDALQAEAERLTTFFAGDIVNSVYAARQVRGERLP
ncbi:MAG: winged helix DNA-binding domain-containing protein [Propioniciclava sp.]|uniref:winged helix DNA-binding domain-containing protein n=1 Tax=Propioniciclava sp. TaxID=2038686 RepID=UPI0039E3F182